MKELSFNVMDIAQNSIKAKSSLIEILITENFDQEKLVIEIIDNGCGMSKDKVNRVINSFYKERNSGLGIPLFKTEAEITGGKFEINSNLGVGTNLKAVFVTSSIEMTPLGDMNATILPLVAGNQNIDFVYTRSVLKKGNQKSFSLDTRKIKSELSEELSIGFPDVVLWIKGYLEENTRELFF